MCCIFWKYYESGKFNNWTNTHTFYEKPWISAHFEIFYAAEQSVMQCDAAVDTLVSDVDGFRRQKIGRPLLASSYLHYTHLRRCPHIVVQFPLPHFLL